MKVIIENIGIFKYAEYELADLNIICGENNTGKTYATYALFGFLDFWKKNQWSSLIPDWERCLEVLMETGTLIIPLLYDQVYIDNLLAVACKIYSEGLLANVFAAKREYFKDSNFLVSISANELKILDTYEKKWQSPNGNQIFQILKESGKDELLISLLIDKSEATPTGLRRTLMNSIDIAIKEIVLNQFFPEVFIASVERTGAVIFKDELDIHKNALRKELTSEEDLDINSILHKIYTSNYALPVSENIVFIRKLETIAKVDSYITKDYPEVLSRFDALIGGTYKVGKEGLYYSPKCNTKLKLTIGESSSSVRALLDIGFYLRHQAKRGDLLIIDEPELNLHPSNQRKIARLLATLVNIGIKVFITTHSDYIIKELNTLIMFSGSQDKDQTNKTMVKYGYDEKELIKPEQVRVYISKKQKIKVPKGDKKSMITTLIPAEVDPFYGIVASSFDDNIIEMNRIQKEIIFGS